MSSNTVNVYELKGWLEATKKLEREVNTRLDNGEDIDSINIDLKNRLWRMKEDGVSRTSPEFCALSERDVNQDAAIAASYYRNHGWHHKHSGEWVKKED